MPARENAAAAPPPKPVRPDPAECCKGGCEPCIFELYEDDLARWEAAVAAWQAAQGADDQE